jgi:hypothetical protein
MNEGVAGGRSDGCWDLIDTQTRMKFMTGVAHYRSHTMMNFKAQEKKNLRMLAKPQSSPPEEESESEDEIPIQTS